MKGPFGDDKDSAAEYSSSSVQKANFTLSDVAAEMDRLYSRPYNLVVPIIAIMPIAIRLFQGATEDGVESATRKGRPACAASAPDAGAVHAHVVTADLRGHSGTHA